MTKATGWDMKRASHDAQRYDRPDGGKRPTVTPFVRPESVSEPEVGALDLDLLTPATDEGTTDAWLSAVTGEAATTDNHLLGEAAEDSDGDAAGGATADTTEYIVTLPQTPTPVDLVLSPISTDDMTDSPEPTQPDVTVADRLDTPVVDIIPTEDTTPALGSEQPAATADVATGSSNSVALLPASIHQPAATGWRGWWNRLFSRVYAFPETATERRDRESAAMIAAAQFSRCMNVTVANIKGGVGKTTLSALLADVLAQSRGGSVAAWEACSLPGTLAARTVDSDSGIGELLVQMEDVHSIHQLQDHMGRQTSHAQILGSPTPRPELSAADTAQLHELMEQYFGIIITDTDNSSGSMVWQSAIAAADVLVVPTTTADDSMDGALKTITMVSEHPDPSISNADWGLRSRIIVVVVPLPGTTLRPVTDRFEAASVSSIVTLPYIPSLTSGQKVAVSQLSATEQRSCADVGVTVINALQSASNTQKEN